jgi:hypothetical protein
MLVIDENTIKKLYHLIEKERKNCETVPDKLLVEMGTEEISISMATSLKNCISKGNPVIKHRSYSSNDEEIDQNS